MAHHSDLHLPGHTETDDILSWFCSCTQNTVFIGQDYSGHFDVSAFLNSVQWLSTVLVRDNRIKQRRAWLLLGWVTAERSCPCKQPACLTNDGGSEVTFKPLVPRLSDRESF
ncbi:hypothetical protein J6590_031748 [Homalodisca vitripennis]|nr:hypothetical protein J6590_031748 [Homalodisca vitripennis]